MILPKEKVIYENLNTSFTSFVELLSDLKTNHFSGVVQINFWDYEGILFIDSGNIINALEEFEGRRQIEQDAINSLLEKVKDKNGSISVYSLSSDLVSMLATIVKTEIVYKELTSDFTNLEKLLEKLKDEQHTGYIEILTKEEKHIATIFIQGGDPIESILSTDSTAIAKTGIHPKIFESVKSGGAIFNVYKAGLRSDNSNLLTSAEIVPLLDFWGQAIAIVENRYDPGSFTRVFKEILIKKADKYPFLDPFADELKYANGKLNLEGNFSSNFNQGIIEVLQELLSEIRGSDIHSELETLKNSQSELIEKFSLEDAFNRLLQ